MREEKEIEEKAKVEKERKEKEKEHEKRKEKTPKKIEKRKAEVIVSNDIFLLKYLGILEV